VSGPGAGNFWASPEPSAIGAAFTALTRIYTVAMGRPVATRRIWLDTVDWRLYRQGMALTATASADSDAYILELSTTDGLTVTAGPDALGWPRLLAGLPDPLRPSLEPVLGVRALLPVVRASGTSVAGRLLDSEGKTVSRLVHERPASVSGSRDRLPGRLWLIPLRGYAAAGARAERAVHGAGLVPDGRSGYPAALHAAGLDPDLDRRPLMQPDLPADVAVARVLLSFLDEMEAAWHGTVADIDTEFLHDLRVAVRRSRSTVKLLGDMLPRALVAWVTPELKWLGDLTAPLRDLDVLLQESPSLAARLTSGRPEDLEPLSRHLIQLRTGEQRRLVRGLQSARCESFRARWRSSLQDLASWDGQHKAGPTAAEVGAERLATADRRVLRRGSRITPASPAEDLHNLRKRCKELRYLLEVFTPLLDPADARRAVNELKTLQDVLGTFQDSETQREAVYALAADMMASGDAPAPTILAMGEIAARLHEDQQSARAKCAARFDRFARRSVQRLMARLAHPGTAPTGASTTTSSGPAQ
jgi:CHAD domain-containing protein